MAPSGNESQLPHDRGYLLWTPEVGFSDKMLESVDRWITSLLQDDGVDTPVNGTDNTVANIRAKEKGIVAGKAVIVRLFEKWAPQINANWIVGDGAPVQKDGVIVELKGPMNLILELERTILNILGRLSGIAGSADEWVNKSPIPVACTRKTTWGLLDKWGVHLGGGLTHRLNRKDAKMLKENDFSTFDRTEDIFSQFTNFLNGNSHFGAFLEVESQSEEQALKFAKLWFNTQIHSGKLVIMLDNMSPESCELVHNTLLNDGIR